MIILLYSSHDFVLWVFVCVTLTQVAVPLQADKRAHHNALERKRRDHIKDSFHGLRDSVPSLQGEKVSRKKKFDVLYSITEEKKHV